MNSELIGQLLDWKIQFDHVKPLVLTGGTEEERTKAIKDFALRFFENMIHINLAGNPKICSYLEENPPGRDCMYFLEDTCHDMIVPLESILVFNNAQMCRNIWTHLKFFSGEQNLTFAAVVGDFSAEELQAASDYATIVTL